MLLPNDVLPILSSILYSNSCMKSAIVFVSDFLLIALLEKVTEAPVSCCGTCMIWNFGLVSCVEASVELGQERQNDRMMMADREFYEVFVIFFESM